MSTAQRFVALRLVVLVLLALLFGQGLRLQVAAGSLFRIEAEENRVRELVEYAPRGIFLDRSGVALVQNVPSVDLVADPAGLPDDLELLFAALHQALPQRDLKEVPAQLAALPQHVTSPVTVLRGLTHAEYLAVASRAEQLPGLRVETAAARAYRGNGPFAHLLGYTGKMGPEEVARYPTYLLTELVGKTGLEQQYESLLRGRHGARRVEVDAYGGVQQDLGRTPATPGLNLRLHLDAALQETAVRAVAAALQRLGLRRAAVVALDPSSGGVRALASFPPFPHTDLAQATDPEKIATTLTDPGSPLLNRVTQGQYVPGSTFKLAVAAGALEAGVTTPERAVDSTGGIRVHQWFFPDWKPGGHGRTNLRKALAESVNTYFYTVGGGVGEAPGLGIERLTRWARQLGVGAPTGIDLPEEAFGFLPSPEWKEREKGEAWYIGDTYHAAIGQGDVLLTPLQLATLTAAIANGGMVYAPRLVEAAVDENGAVRERYPPVVKVERAIRDETAATIAAGMRAAVTDGSARGLASLPVSAAAKTGTAELGGTEKTHAWVTAFAPYERPQLVLVLLIEEGGAGDKVAVPVAREILEWYFTQGSSFR